MTKKILLVGIPVILLSLSLYFSIQAYRNYANHYVKTYVASHQITQRTRIAEEDLLEVMLPESLLSENIYYDKKDILGKYVRLSYSIPRGSLIYKGALETDIRDLEHTLLLSNQVNYDIYTSEVKVNSGSLNTDMYVDLYLTVHTNDSTESDLLLENCRITGLYDNNGKAIRDYDMESKVSIISLAVDQSDVAILNKALKIGDLNIVCNVHPYKTNARSKVNTSSEIYTYLQ